MWEKCPPVASHAQFVERGVKEGTLASSTNRGEEQRSCLAINRSANVARAGIDGDDDPVQRVSKPLISVDDHLKNQPLLQEEMGVADHKEAFRQS